MRIFRHFAQWICSYMCLENGRICEKCSVYAGLWAFKGEFNYTRKSDFAYSCGNNRKYVELRIGCVGIGADGGLPTDGAVGVFGETENRPT